MISKGVTPKLWIVSDFRQMGNFWLLVPMTSSWLSGSWKQFSWNWEKWRSKSSGGSQGSCEATLGMSWTSSGAMTRATWSQAVLMAPPFSGTFPLLSKARYRHWRAIKSLFKELLCILQWKWLQPQVLMLRSEFSKIEIWNKKLNFITRTQLKVEKMKSLRSKFQILKSRRRHRMTRKNQTIAR